MKKFFKKHGRFLQGLYIALFFAALITLGCNRNPYEDLNKHPGSVVLDIKADTITSDSIVYHFYLRSAHGKYESIRVDPEWAVLFEEGDVL